MKTFIAYHPRKLQNEGHAGRINISRFVWLRDQLKKEGVNITIPSGN